MKRLLPGIAVLLLLSLKSSSQIGTGTEDTAKVRLSVPVAFKAVTDIIHYDDLKEVNTLMSRTMENLQLEIHRKDSQLVERDAAIANLKLINGDYAALNATAKAESAELQVRLRRAVRVGRFKVVLIGASLAFGLYQTLKR